MTERNGKLMKSFFVSAACLAALLHLLSGCASVAPPTCSGGQQAAVQDFLYFGTQKPQGAVTSEEWAGFLAETFAQGFPDGFTVWPADGQWRAASGEIFREESYVLSLVHPPSAAAETRIRDFMGVYRTRFEQESVLRVTSPVCVSF